MKQLCMKCYIYTYIIIIIKYISASAAYPYMFMKGIKLDSAVDSSNIRDSHDVMELSSVNIW
jgi:hypothetical protein